MTFQIWHLNRIARVTAEEKRVCFCQGLNSLPRGPTINTLITGFIDKPAKSGSDYRQICRAGSGSAKYRQICSSGSDALPLESLTVHKCTLSKYTVAIATPIGSSLAYTDDTEGFHV